MLKNFRSALVTGGTGFIGSALVRRLSAEGLRVVCLVRSRSEGLSRIKHLTGVELLETDSYELSELKERLAGIHAEVVFNLAAAGVTPGEYSLQQLLAGNLKIVASLTSIAAGWNGLRGFIHMGSCSEYGPAEAGHKLTEDDSLRPVSLYGIAKSRASLYGSELAAANAFPFVTLRLFGVFGVGEAPHRLVPYVIRYLQNTAPVDLTPGEQIRDFLYIEDAVQALLTAAETEGMPAGSCWNVCSGKGTAIREMAEKIADLMNKPRSLLRFGERTYRADEPMWMVGDNKRFAALTGWAPEISIEEGIRRMLTA